MRPRRGCRAGHLRSAEQSCSAGNDRARRTHALAPAPDRPAPRLAGALVPRAWCSPVRSVLLRGGGRAIDIVRRRRPVRVPRHSRNVPQNASPWRPRERCFLQEPPSARRRHRRARGARRAGLRRDAKVATFALPTPLPTVPNPTEARRYARDGPARARRPVDHRKDRHSGASPYRIVVVKVPVTSTSPLPDPTAWPSLRDTLALADTYRWSGAQGPLPRSAPAADNLLRRQNASNR